MSRDGTETALSIRTGIEKILNRNRDDRDTPRETVYGEESGSDLSSRWPGDLRRLDRIGRVEIAPIDPEQVLAAAPGGMR